MNQVISYIEFYSGKRRPNIDCYLNNQLIAPVFITVDRVSDYQENIISTFDVKLIPHNIFQIVMRDKMDQDLVDIDSGFIDHWVKIREFEVDGIKFETSMYNACKFEHHMPDEWVERMKSQGYNIDKCYPNSTDIRLNGTWTINFNTPIWEWCVQRYAQ